MSARGPFAVWVSLLLLAASGTSLAQRGTEQPEPGAEEAQREARERFQSGIAHFNAGRYREAELDFERGYALTQKPGFLWNMAEAARSAGASERALALYQRYLREAEPDAPRLQEARDWVRTLEAAQRERAARTEAAAPESAGARVPEDASRFAASAPAQRDEGPGIHETWWFWASAAVLAAAGVATAVVLSQDDGGERRPELPPGTLFLDWRTSGGAPPGR